MLAVGTPALRLYLYEPGPLLEPSARVAVVGDDPDEVLRSPCDLALLASPSSACAQLAALLPQRTGDVVPLSRPAAPTPPAAGEALRAAHVVAALAERLPDDTILVEEAPSTRPEILARIAIRSPLGFVAVANGALGFGLAGAVGLRMARPDRPVLALLGDGSSLYSIQTLWSAANYGVGVVFVVLGNGRYAVLDELARAHGGRGAWPSFDSVEPATIAAGLGCRSERIATHDELVRTLDEVIPSLRERSTPLLLDVRVAT